MLGSESGIFLGVLPGVWLGRGGRVAADPTVIIALTGISDINKKCQCAKFVLETTAKEGK